MHQQLQRMLLGFSKISRKFIYSLSKKQSSLRFLWVFQDELLKRTLIKGINWDKAQFLALHKPCNGHLEIRNQQEKPWQINDRKEGNCKRDMPKRGDWLQRCSDPLNFVITVVSFPSLQKRPCIMYFIKATIKSSCLLLCLMAKCNKGNGSQSYFQKSLDMNFVIWASTFAQCIIQEPCCSLLLPKL